jgi:hypothetical protein
MHDESPDADLAELYTYLDVRLSDLVERTESDEGLTVDEVAEMHNLVRFEDAVEAARKALDAP